MKNPLMILTGMMVCAVASAQSVKAYAHIDARSEAEIRFALQIAERLFTRQSDARFALLCTGRCVPLLQAHNSALWQRLQDSRMRHPQIEYYLCGEAPAEASAEGLLIAVDCAQKLRSLQLDGWFQVDVRE